MELMESAWLEMGLWDLFQQGRGANASFAIAMVIACLLYTSPSPRDGRISRMPSSA